MWNTSIPSESMLIDYTRYTWPTRNNIVDILVELIPQCEYCIDDGYVSNCVKCILRYQVADKIMNLLPYAGISWSGFNIYGDRESVKEVKRLIHMAYRADYLQKEVIALHDELNNK